MIKEEGRVLACLQRGGLDNRFSKQDLNEAEFQLSRIQQAMIQYDHSQDRNNLDNNVYIMSALIIVIHAKDKGRKDQPNRVQLKELLQCCQIPLPKFLSVHTSLFNVVGLDLNPDLLFHANVLKEQLTMMYLLYTKYDQLYATYGKDTHDALYELGWILFLTFRRRLKKLNAGLGELYHLVLAALYIVLPQCKMNHQLDSCQNLDIPQIQKQTLDLLCSNPTVAKSDVEFVLKQIEVHLHDLINDHILQISGGHGTLDVIVSIVDECNVIRNLYLLQSYYQMQYVRSIYDIDECLFLNDSLRKELIGLTPLSPDNSNQISQDLAIQLQSSNGFKSNTVLPTETASWGQNLTQENAWQWDPSSKPNMHPLKSPTPTLRGATGSINSPSILQTPVSAAVETNHWVHHTLSTFSDGPSAILMSYFEKCVPQNPNEMIRKLILELSGNITSKRTPPTSQVLLDTKRIKFQNPKMQQEGSLSEVEGSIFKTKKLGIGLYYNVLESLLDSERQRLPHMSNFYALLSNTSFHRALFACSMEVMLKAHSLVTFTFPTILTTLQVNAFDFAKIIESFVRRAQHLPSELKRHMRDLEQTVLNSLVWASNSGLYLLLEEIKQDEHNVLATNKLAILQLFLRKVLSLAANRIYILGKVHLELDHIILNQIWTSVKECLSSSFAMLRNRHLDHIILCSIYGVCKVNHVKPEVTFKRVIECYKSTYPHQSKSGIIRDILLEQDDTSDGTSSASSSSGKRGDVIKFYNCCYIPHMKGFLLQFQLHEKQQAAVDAIHSQTSNISSALNDAKRANLSHGNSSVSNIYKTNHWNMTDNDLINEAVTSTLEKILDRKQNNVADSNVGGTSTLYSEFGYMHLPGSDVQHLPRPAQRTSPKRVLKSNIYMSPLRQTRPIRSALTPRTHALYAFGESPSRDLAVINRAVNTIRKAPVIPCLQEVDSTEEEEVDIGQKRKKCS